MENDWALALINQLLWNSMLVAGPMLIAALATGLIVSVFQVATQLQEMTLSYVPKLLISAVVLMLLGSWMMHTISQFAMRMIATIPDLN